MVAQECSGLSARAATMRTENIHLLLAVYQKVAPHAFPYLVMMALRIVELHRVLKATGSFYLHCDPTMSHYLKRYVMLCLVQRISKQ